MHTTKVKSYSYSLAELKDNLQVDQHDSTYDAKIVRTYKSAIAEAEGYVDFDIAPTTVTLTDYCVYANIYCIRQPDITIQAISGESSTGNVALITGYRIRKYRQFTEIIFSAPVSIEVLTVVYTCGYTVMPDDLKQGVYVKLKELFDQSDQYMSNQLQSTRAFERILSRYKNLIL